MLILWDIERGASIRVLPVYEGIEGTFVLPKDAVLPDHQKINSGDIYAASAGEKGKTTSKKYQWLNFLRLYSILTPLSR